MTAPGAYDPVRRGSRCPRSRGRPGLLRPRASGCGDRDGALFAKREPQKKDAYADILGRAGRTELVAEGAAKESEEAKAYAARSFGAQFAEVRVDPELGAIRVTRLVGAFAAGKISPITSSR